MQKSIGQLFGIVLIRTMLGLRYKHWYLLLTIIGFIVPNVFVIMESASTGNVLLWARLSETLDTLFSTNVPAAFTANLFLVHIVFVIWSYKSSKKYRIPNIWLLWLLSLVVGLATIFPLFLYLRELRKDRLASLQ